MGKIEIDLYDVKLVDSSALRININRYLCRELELINDGFKEVMDLGHLTESKYIMLKYKIDRFSGVVCMLYCIDVINLNTYTHWSNEMTDMMIKLIEKKERIQK